MPRIGLLSDSHGRAATTRRAVEVLLARGVDLLIHLGDIGSVEVLDALAVPSRGNPPSSAARNPQLETRHSELPLLEAHLVFGNTDWDAAALGRYARGLGLHVDDPVGRLRLDTGDLVFCHGHQPEVLARALAEPVRYLCHGHTHRALDTRHGPTRVINPGALFRARAYSVALLDTAADELAFYPVPGG